MISLDSDIIGQFDAVWDMRGLFAIPGYEEKVKWVNNVQYNWPYIIWNEFMQSFQSYVLRWLLGPKRASDSEW